MKAKKINILRRINNGEILTPKELSIFSKEELAEKLHKKLFTIHSLREINKRNSSLQSNTKQDGETCNECKYFQSLRDFYQDNKFDWDVGTCRNPKHSKTKNIQAEDSCKNFTPKQSNTEQEEKTDGCKFCEHNKTDIMKPPCITCNQDGKNFTPKQSKGAEEILNKHFKKKNLTNDHIHIAAYTSCINAMQEYASQHPKVSDEEIEEEAEKWGNSEKENGDERFYGYHYDTAFESFIKGAKWFQSLTPSNTKVEELIDKYIMENKSIFNRRPDLTKQGDFTPDGIKVFCNEGFIQDLKTL